MDRQTLINQLNMSRICLERSASALTEEDSGFVPADDMMSVAQQVAHIAHTVDWFREGVFGEGFDMDFEAHAKIIMAVTSLEAALKWNKEAYDAVIQTIENTDDETLQAKLPPNPIMGETPRIIALTGILDHGAHHRGALTVYTRLLGKVPPMPYMEE